MPTSRYHVINRRGSQDQPLSLKVQMPNTGSSIQPCFPSKVNTWGWLAGDDLPKGICKYCCRTFKPSRAVLWQLQRELRKKIINELQQTKGALLWNYLGQHVLDPRQRLPCFWWGGKYFSLVWRRRLSLYISLHCDLWMLKNSQPNVTLIAVAPDAQFLATSSRFESLECTIPTGRRFTRCEYQETFLSTGTPNFVHVITESVTPGMSWPPCRFACVPQGKWLPSE